MRRFALCLVVWSFPLLLWSQQQKFTFSKEVAKYPEEVKNLLGSSLLDEDEKLVDNFTVSWKTGFLTDEEKTDVIALSNLMLEKKARGIPHFKSLMKCLLAMKGNDRASSNYAEWMKGMFLLLKATKASLTAFSNYMDFSSDLASNSNVYESSSTVWKYQGDNYTFKTDPSNVYVVFGKGTLVCYSRRDSILIYDTEGVVDPVNAKWNGKGGMVNFERAGYTSEQANVKLIKYRIDLKKSEFDADSVLFTNKQYFSSPIPGRLHHEVSQIPLPEKANYPQFESYNKRFKINGLYPGVNYDGGFSMRGSKIIGSGSEKEDAIIQIVNDGKVIMRVNSKYFVFRPDKVNGINTQVTIKLENDSIFHSDVSFVYLVKEKEINLFRGEDYSSRSMYFDTYHKLDMDFELFSWKIGQPVIDLTMSRASAIGRARFVSQNFYNQMQFEKLQGIDDIHPLVAIRKYARSVGTDKFNAMGFAHYRNKGIEEVRQVLMAMAQEGFIFYNIQTDEVRLKKKLYDYLDSSIGKIDYDVVDFNSSTQAPTQNATLNMKNYDLVINGIPRIFLSDSQNVVIYPRNEQIIMKRNRSFQFDGQIDAGLFTFYGNNFFFDYDEFKINLQNVDSVQIKVLTGELDNFGRPLTRYVRNTIQKITGDLVIDKSNNKSGRVNYPQYPLFTSRENSYVYYNSAEIQKGVYPKDKFYFELKPFVLDSLDNFKKEGMVFDGSFNSAGILPVIDHKLYLQPDYSLGFKLNTSQDGIPVYDKKGMLYADVQLSNNGLRANGKLNHLTSTTKSDDFVFYPDSMITVAQSFEIAKQDAVPSFPQVSSYENPVQWLPKKEEMNIRQKKDPFQMFNDKTTLAGNLKLKPTGLLGEGKMDLTTAELISNGFTYQSNSFDADTARFNLRSVKKPGFTVLTTDVAAHVDFAGQKGEFTSVKDYSLVEFPENRYVSYLDHFNWNMADKTLEMTSQKKKSEQTTSEASRFPYRFSEEPEGPRYISVHPRQDSLSFVSPRAVYDYANNVINASDVKLLRVADAIIYTSDGKVTVEEGAVMRTLYKANVVANYQTKYHTFRLASVNIQSRKSYTGQGDYDYRDEMDSVQVVHFKEIKVDTALQTIGNAEVLETDKFKLSPFFGFQGKINLSAGKPLLDFDGAALVKAECGRIQPQWLSFESEIDPKNVMIPVSSDPVNINRNKITVGVLIANDSIHIYPAFLTRKRNYADIHIATAEGYLMFDKTTLTYNIAQKDKILDHNLPGNFVSLHRDDCIEYGEGKLNLGVDLGQVKLTTVGNVTHNIIPNKTTLDFMMGMDFLIDPVALNIFANKVDSFPNLEGSNLDARTYTRGMNEILGVTKAKAYADELKLYGFAKVYPPELTHTISFGNVKLTWDDETNSYYYIGKVEIASIGTVQINRKVDAYIEVFKKRTGDIMDVYLKLDDKNWFYFGYTRGVMQTLSSYTNYVDLVRKLPTKVRQMDVASGQTPYIYMVASDTKWMNFRRQYQQRLNKLAMPEEEMPSAPVVIPEQEQQQQQEPENKPEVKQDQNVQPPVNKENEALKKADSGNKKDEKQVPADSKKQVPESKKTDTKKVDTKKPEEKKEQKPKEENKEEEGDIQEIK